MKTLQNTQDFIRVELDNLLWSFAICAFDQPNKPATEFYYFATVSDKSKTGSYHSRIEGDSIAYLEIAQNRLAKDVPSLIEEVKANARENGVGWMVNA